MSDERSANAAAGVEPRNSPFQVGEWLAEPAWNRIRRNDETRKLEPRVMRLLATLAAAPAQPLTREQLLDTVWPDVLVNEEALSRAISQLRRALGDDPRAPRFVETVHKGGYCLIAPVGEASVAGTSPARPEAPAGSRRWLWPVLAIVSLALLAAFLAWGDAPSRDAERVRQLVPLTSEPGREIDPAVSPDGNRVVYLASTGAGYDLFVRGMEDAAPRRLTSNPLAKGHPTWSPDASRIAFVATNDDAAAIYVVGSKGGAVTKLIDLASWSFGLDWSPDGRTLAYSDAGPGEIPRIVLLDVASRAARPIGTGGSSAADTKPVFSPDGRRVAFIRNNGSDRQQIGVVDLLRPGDVKILGAAPQQLRGIDWAPDGKSVIFSARSGRRFSLWRVAVDGGGAPQALAVQGGDLFNPSVWRDGRIVVEDVEQDRDIWRMELGRSDATPLSRSTFDDYEPAYAVRGTQLAFVSERSGSSEIWLHLANGRERRVTTLGGPEISRISWSRDGKDLAFLADEGGVAAIYSATLDGKTARLLQASRGEVPIGWTTANDRLLLLAREGRDWRIEELTLSTRARRRISDLPIAAAAVAGDGRSVFAVAAGENLLLQIAPDRGIVRQFRLPPSLGAISAILPAGDAVYLVKDDQGTAVIHKLNLKTGKVSEAARLDHFGGGRLTMSASGQFIAYTQARETANDLAWTRL